MPQFNPSQLAGCTVWMRADKGVVRDRAGNLVLWQDYSRRGVWHGLRRLVQFTYWRARCRLGYVARSRQVQIDHPA